MFNEFCANCDGLAKCVHIEDFSYRQQLLFVAEDNFPLTIF